MKASDERVVFDLLACWREGSQDSVAEKKAVLEKKFSETAEYKAFVSSLPRELHFLHTKQSNESNASRKRLPRTAKKNVDYTRDPYKFVDEKSFTDDEVTDGREEDEEGMASDEDLGFKRKEEPKDWKEKDDSIVASDHVSEGRRSQTCEEVLAVDNGSDLESGGYSGQGDSDSSPEQDDSNASTEEEDSDSSPEQDDSNESTEEEDNDE